MLCTNELDRVAASFLGPADPSTENGPKQFEWQRNTRRSRLGHVCSKCSANTWLLTRLRDVWFIVKGARYNGLHAHLVPLLHRQASARAGTGWHSENVQLNWRQWIGTGESVWRAERRVRRLAPTVHHAGRGQPQIPGMLHQRDIAPVSQCTGHHETLDWRCSNR